MGQYVAFIHKTPETDYSVEFPDFPGCVSAGKTVVEAANMAKEALELHLEGMAEDGEEIPAGSDERANAHLADRKPVLENGTVQAFLVDPTLPAAKVVRVNITLPEKDLKAIDAVAAAHGTTRSGFLLDAARRAIREDAA